MRPLPRATLTGILSHDWVAPAYNVPVSASRSPLSPSPAFTPPLYTIQPARQSLGPRPYTGLPGLAGTAAASTGAGYRGSGYRRGYLRPTVAGVTPKATEKVSPGHGRVSAPADPVVLGTDTHWALVATGHGAARGLAGQV